MLEEHPPFMFRSESFIWKDIIKVFGTTYKCMIWNRILFAFRDENLMRVSYKWSAKSVHEINYYDVMMVKLSRKYLLWWNCLHYMIIILRLNTIMKFAKLNTVGYRAQYA